MLLSNSNQMRIDIPKLEGNLPVGKLVISTNKIWRFHIIVCNFKSQKIVNKSW